MKKIVDKIKSKEIGDKLVKGLKAIGAFFKKIWVAIKIFLTNEKFRKFFSSKIFQRIVLALVIIFALVQVTFGVLIYGFKSEDKVTRIASKVLPFPIAIANQDFISYNQYLHEKDYIHHFYASTQQEGIDYAEVDKQIIDQLVDNKLIAFQASKNGIHVKKADVDAAVNDIVDQNGGKEKVEKVLNDLYGLNLNQFRELVETQMLRDQVDKELIARVTASHILIRVDKDAPEDKVLEAKTKIEGIKKEIDGGLDFAEAAKKYSEDTGSAEQGGALEPFASGEMVPEFSKAAFEAKVGSITDPVRTEFGWHIIKVESKTGKVEKSFADWLDGLKKNSLVLKLIK